MKKIFSLLLVVLFIICGFNGMIIQKKIDYEFTIELNDSLIYIAPISIINNQDCLIINENGEQTNDVDKIHSISYKQYSKNVNNSLKIKKELKSNETLDNITTYDYVIITIENLYNAIISSNKCG